MYGLHYAVLSLKSRVPRGGRDRLGGLMRRPRYRFNSRVRGGRDRSLSTKYIEARCFNSRVREGRDLQSYMQIGYLQAFQLTRPRGTRLINTRR